MVFLPAICPPDYVPIISKCVSFHDIYLQPNNKLCNIAALDGTNQKHNVSDIYTAYLYQTTNLLNALIIWIANCWLENQGQNFVYSGIQALEKGWTKCILVAKDYAEKWQNMI